MTIETLMVFALGFLTAALLSLAVMGAVWTRAVRLTTRRVESAIPLSMAEIKADKDQMRAEFAMATRRLEMSVDALRTKANTQFADLARKTETIRALKAEADMKADQIVALEARRAALEEKLRNAEDAAAEKARELRVSSDILAQKEREFADLDRQLASKTVEGDSQRVEIVALRTQVENLRNQVAQLTRDLAAAEADVVGHRSSFTETQNLLTGERQRVAAMNADMMAMVTKLSAQTDTSTALQNQIAELTTGIAAQTERATREQIARDAGERALALVTGERDRMSAEIASLQTAIEAVKAEKSMMEGALAKAREDREAIQKDMALLKRETEAAWAAERVDGALLRERINDVAVEVARVVSMLEGPNGTIQSILDDSRRGPGIAPGSDPASGDVRSLGDRIRAIQAQAREVKALEQAHRPQA